VKIFWLIVSGVSIVVAAYFLLLRDFDTAFVVAAAGAVAWFLNYRAQLKEITSKADLEERNNEQGEEDDSHTE
jgi:membrane protein implicated in regulation of membrane protease activity